MRAFGSHYDHDGASSLTIRLSEGNSSLGSSHSPLGASLNPHSQRLVCVAVQLDANGQCISAEKTLPLVVAFFVEAIATGVPARDYGQYRNIDPAVRLRD
jgi:hypothetical protein